MRSVEEQEADCRQWVSRENWDITVVRSDNNVSASRYSKKERPDWLALLDDIRSDRIDIVVFWEMSRGTRHRREWADLAELAEDKRLHIMVSGRLYDATDPHDMAYLDHLVTRGVEESGETRMRINRTVRHQAEKGAPSGIAVFGTRSVYDPKTGRLIGRAVDRTPWPEENPETTPVEMIRDAARRIDSLDETPWSMSAEWNRKGWPARRGGPWTADVLVKILKSPSLMGKRRWNGEIQDADWEHPWEKVLTEEQWYSIQPKLYKERSDLQGRALRSDVQHYLSGVAKCGRCGAAHGTGKSYKTGKPLYRCLGLFEGAPMGCTNRDKVVAEDHVEALIVAEFSRPDVLVRFEKRAHVPSEDDRIRLEELKAELEAARQAATRKGPGRLPVATLIGLEESLGEEIAELEEQLRPRPVEPLAVELASTDPIAVMWRWRSWPPEKKRRALLAFTESVTVLAVGRIGRRKLAPKESIKIVWAGG